MYVTTLSDNILKDLTGPWSCGRRQGLSRRDVQAGANVDMAVCFVTITAPLPLGLTPAGGVHTAVAIHLPIQLTCGLQVESVLPNPIPAFNRYFPRPIHGPF